MLIILYNKHDIDVGPGYNVSHFDSFINLDRNK